MDTMEGALVEPAAVGMHAAMLADVKPGKKIVILGAGCIGLMTLRACKCMGATDIAVVDVLDKRLAMAGKLGAKTVINAANEDTLARCQQFSGEMGPISFSKLPVQPSPLSRHPIWLCVGKNHDRRYGSRRFSD